MDDKIQAKAELSLSSGDWVIALRDVPSWVMEDILARLHTDPAVPALWLSGSTHSNDGVRSVRFHTRKDLPPYLKRADAIPDEEVKTDESDND